MSTGWTITRRDLRSPVVPEDQLIRSMGLEFRELTQRIDDS